MAANAASYVLIAPPDRRDAAIASVAAGFRDACARHTGRGRRHGLLREGRQAKVAEMTPRLVEIGLKAKK
jgi:hypothetical protein